MVKRGEWSRDEGSEQSEGRQVGQRQHAEGRKGQGQGRTLRRPLVSVVGRADLSWVGLMPFFSDSGGGGEFGLPCKLVV